MNIPKSILLNFLAFLKLCNDDGTWLRLSTESIREWCLGQHSEAWCLQFNQHTGKTLLFPINTIQIGPDETRNDPPSLHRTSHFER